MKRKNLYLMCGIPGSGKSTFCNEMISKSDRKTEYIEGDGSASNPYVVDTSEVDGQ